MYLLYYILPAVLMIPIWIYLYFFLKRTAGFYQIAVEKAAVKFMIAAISLIIVIPAANIWGFWAVVVLHFTALSVVTDLAVFLLKKLQRIEHGGFRNKRYLSGWIPVLGTLLILGYGWWNMSHITETEYTVYTDKKIREEGYRIAFLSDLHFGTTMDGEKLEKVCGKIRQEKPDFVVLGGRSCG